MQAPDVRILNLLQLRAILFPEEVGLVEFDKDLQVDKLKGAQSEPFAKWFGEWLKKGPCYTKSKDPKDELSPEIIMYIPESELWFRYIPTKMKDIPDAFIGILYVIPKKDRKGEFMYLDFICALPSMGYGKLMLNRLFNKYPHTKRWKLSSIPAAKEKWQKLGFVFSGVFDKFGEEGMLIIEEKRVPSFVKVNHCITCKKDELHWEDSLTGNRFCSERCFDLLEKFGNRRK